jgi:hypothetical protein
MIDIVPLNCPRCGAPLQHGSIRCEFCGTNFSVVRNGAKSITNLDELNRLGGHEFEDLIEQLLIRMGFATEGRKSAADGGIDIVAVSGQPLLGGRYIIQCKRYTSSVSSPIVRDLYGVVMAERANKGILITTSAFTSDAIEFAREKQIELIDGVRLIDLLEKHSLLGAEIGGSTSQIAVVTLRNELAGLANDFESRLKGEESSLILDGKAFGNENLAHTYKAYSDWLVGITGKFSEIPPAIMVLFQNCNEFPKGDADLVSARRIRAKFEEVFRHLLSIYGQIRRSRPPRARAPSHELYRKGVLSFIVDYVNFIKTFEEALERGGKQSLSFPMVLHFEEWQQEIDKENTMIREMRRKHQIR